MSYDPDWQPFETAPKGGARILVWFADGREFATAFWNDKEGLWYSEPGPVRLFRPWESGDAPTHWAPGPNRPRTGMRLLAGAKPQDG